MIQTTDSYDRTNQSKNCAEILKMFSKLLILFVFIGGVVCTLDESDETNEPVPGAAYKVSFDKINEYLEKNVESKDADANLAAAKNWLANDLLNNQSEDPNLKEAVKLFTSLDQVASEDSCNENSLEILMNSEAALGGDVLDEEDEEDSSVDGTERNEEEIDRRIEQIFEYYAEKYGSSCLPLDAEPLESKSGDKGYGYQFNQHYYQPTYNQYHPHGYHRRKFQYKVSKYWRKLVHKMRKLRRRRYYAQHHGYHQPHAHHGGNVKFQYNKHNGLEFGANMW